MELGTARISPGQQRLLEGLRKGPDPNLWVEFVRRIPRDPEIESGEEQVHPDWRLLFEAQRQVIEATMPRDYAARISDFITAISPADPEIAGLDPSQTTVSFLLGAGASKPEPSNIPTVRELLPDLITRARRLDREDVTRLADFCDEREITNIEDLLTAAQLATFCSRNATVLRLVNFLLYGGQEPDEFAYRQRRGGRVDLSSVAFLQDTLQVLFGLLSSRMLPAKPNRGHTAIAQFARSHPNCRIVTTNYDCCMDLALGREDRDCDYGMDFSNVGAGNPQKPVSTRLIKLHGSLNWFYCETCQNVQLTDIVGAVESFLSDKAPYPVIAVCRNCHGQRRGLLVPPLALKFDMAPPLTKLLQDANDAFEAAKLIVVVGFSFSEADLYISRMLSKSMPLSEDQKVVIVDPSPDVVNRVRRKFRSSIPEFDPRRLIRLEGDCADLLPKFLRGEFARKVEASPEPSLASAQAPASASPRS